MRSVVGPSKVLAAAVSPTGFSGPDGAPIVDVSDFARYLDYIVRRSNSLRFTLADFLYFVDCDGLRHLWSMVCDDGAERPAAFLRRWIPERRKCHLVLDERRISRVPHPAR